MKRRKERGSIQLLDSNKVLTDSKDIELKTAIDKDVKRTYCEVELFLQDQTRSDMVEVLFLWAKENPEYGYQ